MLVGGGGQQTAWTGSDSGYLGKDIDDTESYSGSSGLTEELCWRQEVLRRVPGGGPGATQSISDEGDYAFWEEGETGS